MKNAIKQRIPKSVEKLKQVEEKFIEGVEKASLQDLSLDELVRRFDSIEQQSQLFKGQILLEARERFRSDKEFGQWCSQSNCLGSQPQRTRLMNLARFFEGRELDKISISAAYEISAPVNADIAVEVYEFARGKNLPLAEVRRQIALKKGVPNTSVVPVDDKPATKTVVSEKTENIGHKEIEIISLEDKITALIDAEIKNPTTAIKLLKDLIDKYQKRFGY